MKYIVILLLLISQHVKPQVEPVSRTYAAFLKKELDFQVEFSSLILRVGNQIDSEISQTLNDGTQEDLEKLEKVKLETILKAKIMEFAEFYEEKISLPIEKKGLFRKYFPLLQFDNIADFIKQSMIGLHGFFKRKGIGVAIGISLGVITEWVSFIFLYQAGLPELIPLSMSIPYGSIYSTTPILLNRLKYKQKLTKLLGGKRSYKAFQEQERQSLKYLKMQSPDQILFPLQNIPGPQESKVMGLVLSKKTFIDGILLKLKIHPKKLSYPTLKIFMLVNGIDSPAIRWVREHEGIPYYIKTALISDLILGTESDEVKNKFLLTFNESLVELERTPYWIELKSWTAKTMNARTPEEILHQMGQIPPEASPVRIMELWEKIILPHYSEKFNMTLKSYRRLKEEISLMNAYVKSKDFPNWNSQLLSEFISRLQKAFKVTIPSCKSPETAVLKYLLKLK